MAKRSALRSVEEITAALRDEIGHDREADLYLNSDGSLVYRPNGASGRAAHEITSVRPTEVFELVMSKQLISANDSSGKPGLFYLPPMKSS